MNVTIIAAECTQYARVNELTESGARIACNSALTIDSDVIFKRGKLFAAARVAWSEGNQAGLEFYRAMPLLQDAA